MFTTNPSTSTSVPPPDVDRSSLRAEYAQRTQNVVSPAAAVANPTSSVVTPTSATPATSKPPQAIGIATHSYDVALPRSFWVYNPHKGLFVELELCPPPPGTTIAGGGGGGSSTATTSSPASASGIGIGSMMNSSTGGPTAMVPPPSFLPRTVGPPHVMMAQAQLLQQQQGTAGGVGIANVNPAKRNNDGGNEPGHQSSAPAASAPFEKQQQQQTTSFEQSEDEDDDDDESWATPSEAFSDPEQYCRIAAAVARNRVPDNQELNCFTTSSATSSLGEDLSAGCTPVWDPTKDITQDLTMKKRLQEAESLVLGLEPTACERGLGDLKLEPGQVQTKFHILWSEEMKKRYFPYPLSKTRPTDKWDSYSKDKQRRWKKKNYWLRVHSSNPREQEPWEGAKFALAQIVALLGSMRERFMLSDVLLSNIRNLDIDVEGVEEWLSTNQGPGEPGGGENTKGTRLYHQMATFSVIDPATTETFKILAQSTDPGMTGKYPADASFCDLDVGLLVVKMSPNSEIDSSSRTSGTFSSSATESSFWGTVSSASGGRGLGSSIQVPSTSNKHKNAVQSRAQRSRRYPSFHRRVGGDRYHGFGLHKLQQQRDLLRKERNFYRDAYHESIHSRETLLRERGSSIAMSASTDKSTTATTSRVSKSYENVISCSVSDASPTVNLSLDSYSNNDYVP